MDPFIVFVDISQPSSGISTEDIVRRLPQDALPGILSVKNPQRAYVKAVSALLKYAALSHALSAEYNDISFGLQEKGKPYVSNFENIHFNISHTKNACAGIFAPFEVGIDTELIRPAELAISRRFFTPNEAEYISGAPHLSDERFFEVWTKKEAYIKLTGEGLGRPLSSFDVLDDGLGASFTHYRHSGFSISACAFTGNKIPQTLKVISAEELFLNPAAIK
ncbi:MAG: 4'-phosphopantetheinyl transferase superfamily protein [Clostridiales bacterium]|nr:4'-phosphopantetheinyl transferase superfamily protein [Clostridiales bacterium]